MQATKNPAHELVRVSGNLNNKGVGFTGFAIRIIGTNQLICVSNARGISNLPFVSKLLRTARFLFNSKQLALNPASFGAVDVGEFDGVTVEPLSK